MNEDDKEVSNEPASTDVIIGRIQCDILWLKEQIILIQRMLESLGAATSSNLDMPESYLHDDNKHGFDSTCDPD